MKHGLEGLGGRVQRAGVHGHDGLLTGELAGGSRPRSRRMRVVRLISGSPLLDLGRSEERIGPSPVVSGLGRAQTVAVGGEQQAAWRRPRVSLLIRLTAATGGRPRPGRRRRCAVVPFPACGGAVVPFPACGGAVVPFPACGGAVVPFPACGGAVVPFPACGGAVVPFPACGGAVVPFPACGGAVVPFPACGGAVVPFPACGGGAGAVPGPGRYPAAAAFAGPGASPGAGPGREPVPPCGSGPAAP